MRDNNDRLRQVLENFLNKGTKIYHVHESCNNKGRTVFYTEKELKQTLERVEISGPGSKNTNIYQVHSVIPVTKENMEKIIENENIETVLDRYAEDNKDKQILINRSRQKKDKGIER